MDPTDEKAQKLAQGIIDTFIVNNAPMQMNIDFGEQQKVLNYISGNFEAIYNIESVVLQQLNDDAYLRFVQSKEFKEYLSIKSDIKTTIDAID